MKPSRDSARSRAESCTVTLLEGGFRNAILRPVTDI